MRTSSGWWPSAGPWGTSPAPMSCSRGALAERAPGPSWLIARWVPRAGTTIGQTGRVIGILIFAVMAFVVIAAFAAQISRRHRYERGQYDSDDG